MGKVLNDQLGKHKRHVLKDPRGGQKHRRRKITARLAALRVARASVSRFRELDDLRRSPPLLGEIGTFWGQEGVHGSTAEGGHFRAILVRGGSRAASDSLYILGSHPDDLFSKAMLVVPSSGIVSGISASDLVSKCELVVTTSVSGIAGARRLRVRPRLNFEEGTTVVAFLFLMVTSI